MRLIQLSGFSLCLAATAAAQVTSIGPFSGDHSEGFETQPNNPPFVQCIANRVFDATADLCGANGNASMHMTSSWSFMCQIFPHGGSRLFGSTGDPALFTFDADITTVRTDHLKLGRPSLPGLPEWLAATETKLGVKWNHREVVSYELRGKRLDVFLAWLFAPSRATSKR